MAHDLAMWPLPTLGNTKTGVLSVPSDLKTATMHSWTWILGRIWDSELITRGLIIGHGGHCGQMDTESPLELLQQ